MWLDAVSIQIFHPLSILFSFLYFVSFSKTCVERHGIKFCATQIIRFTIQYTSMPLVKSVTSPVSCQYYINISDNRKRKFMKQNSLPSWSGSMVWIINCNNPCRNFAPVAALELWPELEPGGADLLSDAALDVTDPPGCVAIDVSDEFAALPYKCLNFDLD